MWIRLDDEQTQMVVQSLKLRADNLPSLEAEKHYDLVARLTEAPEPTDEAYRTAAMQYANDDFEVDSDAVVSRGGDPGSWVMSWIWITDEKAGVKSDDASCENCGCTDNNGSDVCPDCGGAIV